MGIRVHHLNCGTMNTSVARMVCHVLLIETPAGLVLVDSGMSGADFAEPAARLGPMRHVLGLAADPQEFAINQVRALGFDPRDVRHIVLTHMDFDHAGGISDFPEAQIHVTSAEALGALRGPTRHERIRYNTAQFSHDPKVVEHSPYGERWNDFAAAKELTEIDPGIVLVTMPGHSRGHACVAVDDGGRWLLHCGDAFDHRNEIRGLRRRVPFGMKAQAYLNAFDLGMYLDNQDRLHELWKQRDPNLMIFNAHDATLFDESKAAPVS